MDIEEAKFNSEAVSTFLDTLEGNHQSIEQTSQFLMGYTDSEAIENITDIWAKKLAYRKLEKEKTALIYLMNEILMKCRGMNDYYISSFLQKMDFLTNEILESGSSNLNQIYFKLLQHWVENKIYSTLDIKNSYNRMEDKINQTKSDKLPDNLPNPSGDVCTLAEKFKELENNKQNISKLKADSEPSQENINRQLNNQIQYRTNLLQSYRSVLTNIDKMHMKHVNELQQMLNQIDKLEQIKEKSLSITHKSNNDYEIN